ncbi:MAG: TonB-dependent receptor [Bryobacterales bacterium]|nr:TonB-dependent receptor [Bryobacterales bacterium]
MKSLRLSLTLGLLALALFHPHSASAQAIAGMGGVSGVVRDASGAVVPEAAVVVANESKGIRRELSTNAAGVFTAPALVPAAGYKVTINKQGFQPYEVSGFEVAVGQVVDLPVTINVASAATQVEVVDLAPVIEQTRTGNSAVVNSALIQNLPINGRRVDSFVLLAPGVVSDGTFGLVSFRGIAGGNSFLTDGNDTTNQYYNENAGRTRISTQISQDAVQEFEVLSSGYSAEYGRATGGVINTVTRSGSNDIHGTGYWFYRNQDFAARDRYASSVPKETRNQVGGSVGGAIVKDKLFYFFNAELVRRDFPLLATMNSSPLFNAAGAFVGACTASQAQCDAAVNFITKRHNTTIPRTANSDLGFGKIDWRPADRHSFSFSFNYLKWISPMGIQTGAALNNGAGIGGNGDSTVRTRYGRVSYTSIPTSTVVNELRYGWFKDRLFDDLNPEYLPAETGRIAIAVQGVSNLGVANYMPRLNPSENRHQIADNLTWTIGRHTLKMGGDIVSTQDYSNQLFNGRGSFNYANFTNFALDFSGNTTGAKRWQSFSQAFGNPIVDVTIRDYSAYIQDQFRATKNLTLNYGLRYEYSNYTQPTITNPDFPQTGRIPTTKTNFAPRFGFAYAFDDSKTVLRGGYGIFYGRYPGGVLNTLTQNNGVYTRNISLNGAVAADLAAGPIFPLVLPSLDRQPPAGTIDVTFAGDDFRNPYTQQADFGIEREIIRDVSINASYLWSRGVQLWTVRDLNIGALGPDVTYRILDVAGNQTGTYTTPGHLIANRVNRNWRRANQVENGGQSWYNGLVTQIKMRRKSHQVQFSYTWSHAIDYNQGGGSDNIFFSGVRSVSNGNYKADKSTSALDQRHRAAFSSIHQPKLSSSDGAVAKFLVNNWQLSQITTYGSAQYSTPTIFVSGTPYVGAPFTTSLNGFGGSSRVPFMAASSIPAQAIFRTDARLTKILPFTERMNLQLNFEVFNVFNNVSDTSVRGQAFQATAGAIRPTPRFGEGSASAGFPDGTNARRAQISARFVF